MNAPVITLRTVEKVRRVVSILKKEPYNGFPIVTGDMPISRHGESFGVIEGLILRSQLIVLLQNKVTFFAI